MMVQTLCVRVVILELMIYLFIWTDCFKLANKGFCHPWRKDILIYSGHIFHTGTLEPYVLRDS